MTIISTAIAVLTVIATQSPNNYSYLIILIQNHRFFEYIPTSCCWKDKSLMVSSLSIPGTEPQSSVLGNWEGQKTPMAAPTLLCGCAITGESDGS